MAHALALRAATSATAISSERARTDAECVQVEHLGRDAHQDELSVHVQQVEVGAQVVLGNIPTLYI